ncbi:MAG: hypothetical protein JNM36_09925 [Chitinophagales bacterium]|nr:hypothetical protein [Chitinophagales bacterium]
MNKINTFLQKPSAFWIILLAVVALTRLVPHIPNVSPVAAMALFGGCYFTNRRWAFALPIAILFVSDLLLHVGYLLGWRAFTGFYDILPYVYGSMLFITAIGILLQKYRHPAYLIGASITSSVLFFLITNFGVWWNWMRDTSTLAQCYVQAIPFFRNTLLGDLLYVGVLFGVAAWVSKKYPSLATLK